MIHIGLMAYVEWKEWNRTKVYVYENEWETLDANMFSGKCVCMSVIIRTMRTESYYSVQC